MENCTIYSHHLYFEKIYDVITSDFSENNNIIISGNRNQWSFISVKNKNPLSTFFFEIKSRKRSIPSYQLEEPVDHFTSNLLGMRNYFKDIETEHLNIKEKLLHKISSVNMEISVTFNPNFRNSMLKILLDITDKTDGVIFSNKNSIFNNIRFLNGIYNKEGNLILSNTGLSNVKDLEVIIEKKYYY
jgi:hypothetical protein